jgi:hypothetical protein
MIYAKALALSQQNILLTRLKFALRGFDSTMRIVQKDSDICIEGYPRSANSVAVQLFRLANDASIGHHVHSIGNVARALRYHIPTIVLIRNPLDAVTSFVVGSTIGGVDYAIEWYLMFYRWVEPRMDLMVIAEFNTVIGDFNSIIRQVDQKYNVNFNCLEDLESAMEQVVQYIRERDAKFIENIEPKTSWGSKILPEGLQLSRRWKKETVLRRLAVPDVQKEKIKEEIRPMVLRNKHLIEAQDLYSRIVKACSDN